MMTTKTEKIDDPYHLTRFVDAQENIYRQVLDELKHGQKRTHWMWFIFPQIDGLGRSPTAMRYAIKSKDEAEAYLNHSILGSMLLESVSALLDLNGSTALQIFGMPDTEKLRSSMTLFAGVSPEDSPYHQILNKYFDGYHDENTLKLIKDDID